MRSALRDLADEDIASHSMRFFKSGKGEYGEGDRFLGIRVPVLRKHVSKFRDAPEPAVLALMRSSFHEERLFAVLLLADQYRRGDESEKARIYACYMANLRFVNNWDIVDSSAHLIVGPQLEHGDRSVLQKLAASDSLWDRRIAMMATYHYIKGHDFADALQIARLLRDDEHDLIHKVVGWMPRTMLRYAIEKFPEALRKAYLNGTV